jgi:hypothetical protein
MGASQRMRTVGRDLVGGARWLRPHDLLVPLHLRTGSSPFFSGESRFSSAVVVALHAQRSGRRSAAFATAACVLSVCGATGSCAPEVGGAGTQPVHVGKAAGGVGRHFRFGL